MARENGDSEGYSCRVTENREATSIPAPVSWNQSKRVKSERSQFQRKVKKNKERMNDEMDSHSYVRLSRTLYHPPLRSHAH